MKILIMGLPGSGKTWLAERLQKHLNCAWFNADARIRQARRMRNLADYEKGCGRIVICDFVCPTELTRHIFEADLTIWMDTIEQGRFEDTNKMFERPAEVDLHIDRFITEAEVGNVVNWIAGVHA
jgi:adenylylsulfate kinase